MRQNERNKRGKTTMTNFSDPNPIAQSINTLADFCAKRDFETLTQEDIQAKTGSYANVVFNTSDQ